jgi:hypothetical protein
MRIDYRDLKVRIRLMDRLDEIGWQPTEGRGVQLRGPCPLPVCQSRKSDQSQANGVRSFSVHIEKNVYRCFGCSSSGTVLDFWRFYRGTTLYEAAKELTTLSEPESINRNSRSNRP